MKIFKSSILAALAIGTAFAFTACSEDGDVIEYVPAASVPNPDVCFSLTENTTIQLQEDQTNFTVNVYRKSGEGSATYPLAVTNASDVYTSYPSEVTFPEGATQTSFEVYFDIDKIEKSTLYPITFALSGVQNTDYYLGSVTYNVFYEPWILVTGPNGEDKAQWRDNLLWGLFSFPEEESEWEVTIEQSPNNPGVYRIQNPYLNCAYLEGYVDESEDLYWYFNTTNPKQVFFCDAKGNPQLWTSTGVDVNPSYGNMLVTSEANMVLDEGGTPGSDTYGTFRNGNLTWGADMMYVQLSVTGGIYYANGDGLFRIVWPGYEPEEDPANVWTSIGEAMFTDAYITTYIEDPLDPWAVTIQQNGANPDYYRLVDPYGMVILGEPIDAYMYFDCTEHNNVFMPLDKNMTGLGMNGMSFIATNAAEVYINYSQQPATPDQIIEAGLNSTFDGKKIVVPAEAVCLVGRTSSGLSLLDIPEEYQRDCVVVLPTEEQTAAYRKGMRPVKRLNDAQRRAAKISGFFKSSTDAVTGKYVMNLHK